MRYPNRTTPFPRPCPRQRGIALILVLWAVALLTVVAASFAFDARTDALLATGVVDKARADAAAEAGVRRAVAGLLQPGDLQWEGDGEIRSMLFGNVKLRIHVQSAHAKIDLNAAPDALIDGAINAVLASSGSTERPDPGAVVDAILDWRDQDHSRRPNGAEDADYYRLGREFGAADQSFTSVSELLQVRGVSRDFFVQIAPIFTVYTRSPRVDPGSASREVLLSVPGLTKSAVEEFVQARTQRQNVEAGAALPRLPIELLVAGAGYLTRTRPSVYEILVEARLEGGQVGRRGAVIKLTRNRRQPYQTLAWFIESDTRFSVFDTPARIAELR